MTSYEAKEAPSKGMEIFNRQAGAEQDMSTGNYIRWDAEGVEMLSSMKQRTSKRLPT